VPGILTLLAALLAVVSLASVQGASAQQSVTEKRAQAKAVLDQIREVDAQLGLAIEEFNLANVRLGKIDGDLKANGRHLTLAKSSLGAAQTHLSERLVALYVNGSDATAIEVLLGAESLDDLLSRLDAVDRVSEQDVRVLREVKTFKTEVQKRKVALKKARVAQEREVARRSEQRSAIEAQMQERERMLASIRTEIASLEAAEARRQARLEAQARQRVAALTQSRRALSLPTPADAPIDATESAEPEVTAPAPDARYGGAVAIAMQYLGIPYKWGGASPETGFDCSGFTMYVYAKLGVSLPHHAATQFGMGTPVSKADLQPGDLVFFRGLGHMGMYIGGGQFIHSPRTGDVVKISNLSDPWYTEGWIGARRL